MTKKTKTKGSTKRTKVKDLPVAEKELNQGEMKKVKGGVRVNNLANLESLLNIVANGPEVLGIKLTPPDLDTKQQKQ